ncbi:MAG: hypothetical protein AAB410_02160 [Patescibacteria group bacterium]
MQVLLGKEHHTTLTQELGIDENKTNFLKGYIQNVGHGLAIGGNWNVFFEEMGIGGELANELWESIRSRIITVFS